MSKGIYVEIPIRGSMEELWEKTQNPALHQRWDLRFTQIEYVPRKADEAQKFLYRTRIGFGLNVDGEGESTGCKDGDQGARTSSLKFWSDDAKSLIRAGSGYWKYVPNRNSIRFFTWYDYETRFGALGKLTDRFVFRPLLGWATAWSFDRLRLWIERGISPESSRDRAIVYCVSRVTVAFIWMYHGLIPKLLFDNLAETDLLRKAGLPASYLHAGVTLAGWAELVFGLLLAVLWSQRWPLWLTLAFMLIGIPVVGITAPEYLTAAFNPLTLNLAVAALAMTALFSRRELPSASRCLRRPESKQT
jgi:uncharacterized membrane protein YphA (DoxX/SURF4 family)